jgi:aspartyl-tRNA(Asn)/glutamyl-tRNA(Gln) amidotransferase subunit C
MVDFIRTRDQQAFSLARFAMENNVDRTEIKKLSTLARIEISDATIDEVTNSITDILSLVDQLQAVDTTGVEPMAHPLDAVQRLRTDIVSESNQRESFQTIAPMTEDGLYLVPKVID